MLVIYLDIFVIYYYWFTRYVGDILPISWYIDITNISPIYRQLNLSWRRHLLSINTINSKHLICPQSSCRLFLIRRPASMKSLQTLFQGGAPAKICPLKVKTSKEYLSMHYEMWLLNSVACWGKFWNLVIVCESYQVNSIIHCSRRHHCRRMCSSFTNPALWKLFNTVAHVVFLAAGHDLELRPWPPHGLWPQSSCRLHSDGSDSHSASANAKDLATYESLIVH